VVPSSSSLLPSSLELSDTKVYEPQIRARLGTAAHLCGTFALRLEAGGRSACLPPCSPAPGFGVWGSRLRVWGLGFRVQGSGFRVLGLGLWVEAVGSGVQGVGFRVQGSGFGAWGAWCRGNLLAQLLKLLVECALLVTLSLLLYSRYRS